MTAQISFTGQPYRQFALATPGRVVALHCDIPEGLQREHLHVYDLRLPAGRAPQNQDGEVAWHQCWPVAEALAAAATGRFTADAALATLDFAVRHGGFRWAWGGRVRGRARAIPRRHWRCRIRRSPAGPCFPRASCR